MNWNNLKDFKCPKCSSPLTERIVICESNQVSCATSYRKYPCTKCEFTIGEEKYNELLRSKPKYQRTEEDNLSELNNY